MSAQIAAQLRAGAARLRPGQEWDEPGWWVARGAVYDAADGPCEAYDLLQVDGYDVDDLIAIDAGLERRLPGTHGTTSRQEIRFLFLHFIAEMLEGEP
jgi:hypothetical protein